MSAGEVAVEIEKLRREDERIIRQLVGDFDPLACQVCLRCVSGCTAFLLLEFKPHRLVHLVRMGAVGEFRERLWECVTCQKCADRCPQQVTPVELVIALRNLAVREGHVPEDLFNAISRLIETGYVDELRALSSPEGTVSRESLGLPPLSPPPEKFVETLTELLEEIVSV